MANSTNTRPCGNITSVHIDYGTDAKKQNKKSKHVHPELISNKQS